MPFVLSSPPPTPVEPVTDVLHGVPITDPYRWLEDQNSPRTRKWLEEQTAYSRAYLDSIPGRDRIRERITELLSTPVVPDFWSVDDRHFFLKRYGDSQQPVIVMKKGLLGEETILVDPAGRGCGALTAVSIAAISPDGHFLAYFVRDGGTDHSALEILDIKRNVVLPDRLPQGYCSGFAFAPDGTGFFYSHLELQDSRPDNRAAFWHRFGTERSEDREVFVGGEKPNLFLGILNSPQAQLLAFVLFSTGKQRSTSIYLSTLSPEAAPKLLLCGIEGYFIPFFVRGELLAFTDFGAPNFRIVRIDITAADATHWRDVVPESERRIQRFAVAGDQIFVTRIDRFSTKVEAFGLDGQPKKHIPLPQNGSVELLNRTYTTERLFCSHSSISKPTTVYCYEPLREQLSVWEEVNVPFHSSIVALEEVTYTSKDGTSIPLLLAGRKDLLHCSALPTFLTGYGGFGSCVTPRFTAFATFLIEQGFLFAVPALRGGSELGEEWHLAGKCENRQNSFNDFIAAAEWLISQGLSAPDRVAIGGGSNAGLLVGAAITQRPDLFRAAICLGPLLDMTRYHLFDFAAGWADEYGSPEDEHDFRSLLTYSPYHHVEDGAAYPAVLLISGDADTRCNPMHARKMAARLQAASGSGYPILLDYKRAWGHMPVQPLTTKTDALTDRLAFVCHEVGVPLQLGRSL
jgi:prolyl oligopeptidase